MSLDPDELIDDTNWPDMRIGDVGTVVGKLEAVMFGNPGNLVIAMPDWSQLIIQCAGNTVRDTKAIALSTLVRVRVVRTEDGLLAQMIRNLTGGVPIPLAEAADG